MDFCFLYPIKMKSLTKNYKIMKKIKFSLLTALVALFVVFTFSSCDKDEAGIFNPKQKISKIYYKDYNDQEYLQEEWTWDGDLLTKITYFDQGVQEGFENYEYIDKKLNKVIDNYLYYSIYTYDGKYYSKIEYFNPDGTLLSDIVFQYTNEKISQMAITSYVQTKEFYTMLKRSFIGKLLPAKEMDQLVQAIKMNQSENAKSTTNVVFVYDGDNISSLTVGNYITTFTGYDTYLNPVFNFFPFRNFYEETYPSVVTKNNPGTMTTSFSGVDVVTTYTYTYEGDYPTNITASASTVGVNYTTTTRLVYVE